MNKKFVVQCEYEDGQLFYWKFFNYGFGGHYLTNDINDAAIFPSTASGQKKDKIHYRYYKQHERWLYDIRIYNRK